VKWRADTAVIRYALRARITHAPAGHQRPPSSGSAVPSPRLEHLLELGDHVFLTAIENGPITQVSLTAHLPPLVLFEVAQAHDLPVGGVQGSTRAFNGIRLLFAICVWQPALDV
jgi:hypothetical protein